NLSPNDGNPGTGSDEGDIVIWTRIKDSTPPDTIVENCMLVTPTAGGTSGYHCTNFTTGNVDSTKVQGDFTPDRGTTPGGYQEVQAEDTFTYTLTVTNNSAGSRYLRVYDELHRYLAYVPGTFTVNGIVLPDTNVHDTGTNLVIDYRHPAVVAQGSDLTVTFTVKVRPHVAAVDDIIPNVGLVTSCNEFSNDSSCLPAEQTAIVEVQYGNGSPTAVDDTATTSLGTPVTIAVLDNDHDNDDNLDPATLIVQTANGPEDGTAVVVEQNGVHVIEYTPTTPEYFSGDSFGYEVCDSAGLCDTATVTISIENTPPQASDDNTSTFIDTPVTVDVLANDTDAEGNIDFSSLAVVPGYEPLSGTITITSSFEFTYTPDSSGYYDSDAFSYAICDTENECDTAVVTIDLTNRPPIAEDDAASTDMTTPITINVLANDSDPDHNLAFDSVTITHQPAHGTVNLDGQQVIFTPTDPVYFAQDTFEYEVCDTATPPLCDVALVIITITDEAPIASDDIRETKIGIPVEITVLANDSDPDDNLDPATLELLVEAQPEHGTVSITSEHTIIYTPTDTQYYSQDTFSYQVCDTTGLCDTANVIISITDQPPVAADDIASTSPGEEVTIPVQDNDTDPEDNIDPGSLQLVPSSEPAHGSIDIAAGTITYTPDPETTATSDTFSYTICDITGLCDTATVNITITHPVAPSPTPDTEGHPSEGNEQQNKAILPETGKGLLLYLSAILGGIGIGSYMLRISYVRYARPILRRRKV
ncbi:MAG: Ig-like domain-containing protein, partial [Candidatus Dojkabacteria bacterium]